MRAACPALVLTTHWSATGVLCLTACISATSPTYVAGDARLAGV